MVSTNNEKLARGTWVKLPATHISNWYLDCGHLYVDSYVYGQVLHESSVGDNTYMIRVMVPPARYPGEWFFKDTAAIRNRLTPFQPTEKRLTRWAMMVMKG